MHSISSLPKTIPIFPLSGVILLPRSRLPLNIFEPRYLSMVEDVLKTPDRLIGMAQPAPNSDLPGIGGVGCAGRIVKFAETDDRRYLITLAGVCRFSLAASATGFAPYHSGTLDWGNYSHDLRPATQSYAFDRPEFIALLKRYFEIQQLSTDWDNLINADEEMLVNSLSMMCPFDATEKQALLEAETVATRRQTLTALMEFALRDAATGPIQ
ncbi:ATP-dependent protease [Amylibacter marinus]|uniref:ATP-dependent protease n=1 Tax=Amylibacter marinus TaxID=1475483 RepID=A0ABQ5VW48_9RHOB|nr:LON peptidase substrate-binding domain-containing protein [Amylibacter marinus]GLQ35414.1 ATP-dependent protease [Amylibacter marinus]